MIQDGIQQAQIIHGVLMMGQSNMAGRGNLGEVKPIRNPLCYMLRMGRWQPMCEPVNPDRAIFEGMFRSGISLAASFADEYAKHFQQMVGLIPCADGGTNLQQWMPGELNYDHAVMQAKLALRTSSLKAILWHQGESDCQADETVEQYTRRFVQMIEQFRRDIGAQALPVLVGELPEVIAPKWKTEGRQVLFNQNLHRLPQMISNCAVVSSAGLTLKPDGLHFDAQACREFGKRYFESYCTMMQR